MFPLTHRPTGNDSNTEVQRLALGLHGSGGPPVKPRQQQAGEEVTRLWVSRPGDHIKRTRQTKGSGVSTKQGGGKAGLVIKDTTGGQVEEQQGQAGWGRTSSPTLLSQLNPEPGPAPSLSRVDGSGSESVKSLRRRETHIHLSKSSGDAGAVRICSGGGNSVTY